MSAALRLEAADRVCRVLAGQSLDRAWPGNREAGAEPDRALLRELVSGTVRFYFPLAEDLARFLARPLGPRQQRLQALLLVGAYQIRHTRIPDYAAIHASVEAAKRLKVAWAPSLTNAVLRKLAASPPPQAQTHPRWMHERLRHDHPRHWQDILRCNDSRAPMTLRIDLRRSSRAAYAAALSAAGMTSRPGCLAPGALTLDRPVAERRLPHHRCGIASVQDEGAQLAAPLLVDPGHPPARILDACAAPGGKAMHLAELAPRASLTLLDISADRLRSTRARFGARLDRHRMLVGDARSPDTWWDGKPYDAILVDAPCSGTGSLRRNPDIRIHRRAEDLPAMQARQIELLNGLWPALAPHARLLYCTCSLFSAENEDVIDEFLRTHGDAVAEPVNAPWGEPRGAGRLLLPCPDGNDGFFFARLRKDAGADRRAP